MLFNLCRSSLCRIYHFNVLFIKYFIIIIVIIVIIVIINGRTVHVGDILAHDTSSQDVVWLGFTALQHNIGYIAPMSVVNVSMSAHAGVCAEFDGILTIQYLGSGYFLFSPNP